MGSGTRTCSSYDSRSGLGYGPVGPPGLLRDGGGEVHRRDEEPGGSLRAQNSPKPRMEYRSYIHIHVYCIRAYNMHT